MMYLAAELSQQQVATQQKKLLRRMIVLCCAVSHAAIKAVCILLAPPLRS
jgi:hypothetical protein